MIYKLAVVTLCLSCAILLGVRKICSQLYLLHQLDSVLLKDAFSRVV